MNKFIESIRHHDNETLEADARELENQWPSQAAEVYQLLASRAQHNRQHEYAQHAKRCQALAIQQKNDKKAAFLAMSMS